MPRSRTIQSRNYAAGDYGPFPVDGFTRADTDWLVVEFTVEDWPEHPALITGELRWDTGDGADFSIKSPVRDRFGNALPVARVKVEVPQTADGKAAVTSGTLALRAALPLRTAITVTAGADPAATAP